MTELLFIVSIVLTILTIYCLTKAFNRQGLIFSLIILNIVSFITSFKIGEIFKFNVNLGIISFVATLSIMYIFIIKFGIKEIKRIQLICLITNIIVAILLVIMNYIIPTITETVSINIKSVFESNYKIIILYPPMMIFAQYVITKLFTLVSTIQSNIVINIILTYIITGLIYIIIYYLLCYIKVLSIYDSVYIGLSTYIVGLIVTIINSIFINYYVKSKKVLK